MAQVCTSRAVPFVDVTAGLGADPVWRQEVAAGDRTADLAVADGADRVEKRDGAVSGLLSTRVAHVLKIAETEW
ncbi:MAG: hypothetical protein WBR33_18770 [Pseudonocardiaceae bacterium]